MCFRMKWEDSHEESKQAIVLENYFHNEDEYIVCGNLGGLLWSIWRLSEGATEMIVFDLDPKQIS